MTDRRAYAELIAEVTHEANRVLQKAFRTPGIPIAAPWENFPEEQRQGVISGVLGAMEEGRTAEESHEAWCEHKRLIGWTYGPEKDEKARTHPNLVPYAELSADERRKDCLFLAIVQALTFGPTLPAQTTEETKRAIESAAIDRFVEAIRNHGLTKAKALALHPQTNPYIGGRDFFIMPSRAQWAEFLERVDEEYSPEDAGKSLGWFLVVKDNPNRAQSWHVPSAEETPQSEDRG